VSFYVCFLPGESCSGGQVQPITQPGQFVLSRASCSNSVELLIPMLKRNKQTEETEISSNYARLFSQCMRLNKYNNYNYRFSPDYIHRLLYAAFRIFIFTSYRLHKTNRLMGKLSHIYAKIRANLRKLET
jgi:hypothetical protein